ncbi:MAG: polysaccharide biosynthesis/export family protein [Candidatus Acidiferrales bacterium]
MNEPIASTILPKAVPQIVAKAPNNSPVSPQENKISASPSRTDAPQSNSLASNPATATPSASVPTDPADVRATDAEPSSPVEPFVSTSADQEYVIGDEDVLAINVWREPELSRTVPVRPDGKISLPLVGDINANGLTPRMLQARLTKEFDSYIRNPKVTVIVQEVNSRKFYVIGQVEKPGTYPLATHVAILDALAIAGGFRDFAKVQQIYLLRLMPDGTRKRIFFDYKAAVNGRDPYREIELQPGDTVVVP